MADYKKVYAICENKCLEETMSKQQISEELNTVFGIKKTVRTTEYAESIYGPLPESNVRTIYLAGVGYIHINKPTFEIPDNYYHEVVVKFTNSNQRKAKPSDLILGNGITIKWLNDDLDVSDYNVLHYHFTYDGINICCWCTGYA